MNIKRVFFRDMGWLDRPIASCERVLDLGAGGMHRAENVTTMDMLQLPGTDVVHHAESYPWPFEDNTFDYIIISNVFEHIGDLVPFMRELNRVCKKGGIVRGVTPHFSNPCTYADPTHKQALSIHIFDYFCKREPTPPGRALVKNILGCGIALGDQFGEPLFLPHRLSFRFREILWPTLVPLWGNWFQDFFETYGTRLFPAWDIYFELEALVPPGN